MRHADPQYGPVHLSKHDIKDGYYRLFLQPEDCMRLAIILPAYEGEDQLVATPMACTMGWVKSPPTFCTMSETVADETNRRTVENSDIMAAPHRLEEAAAVADEHHGPDVIRKTAPRKNLPRPRRTPQEPTTPAHRPHDGQSRPQLRPPRAPLARGESSDSDERAPPSNRVAA